MLRIKLDKNILKTMNENAYKIFFSKLALTTRWSSNQGHVFKFVKSEINQGKCFRAMEKLDN